MAEKITRGFEVVGKPYEHDKDVVAQLAQVFDELNRRPPEDGPGVAQAAGRFIMKRAGDRVMLEYHLMDLYLDDNKKCEGLVKDIHKGIGTFAGDLKKEFKKRAKVALKLKEDKDSAGWHREKVSLNGHWYLRCWRVYDVTPEADQSDEG